MTNRNLIVYSTLCIVIIPILSSCYSYKNIAYFNDFVDTARQTTVATVPYTSPIIEPDDLLTITVQTVDPDINAVLNSTNVPNSAVGASSALPTGQQIIPGYLVDKNGEVELPFAGAIKLQGHTTVEAREIIRTEMLK